MQSIKPPYLIWQETDGTPLDQGYIYIGTANTNPITNPIQLYWGRDGTSAAAQPVRTSGGYAMRNNSPGMLYCGAADYSLTVQDRNGAQVYTAASLTQLFGITELDSDTIAAALLESFYEKSVVLPLVLNCLPQVPAGPTAWQLDATLGLSSATNGAVIQIPFPTLVTGTVITQIDLKVRKDAGTITLAWGKRDTNIGTAASAPTVSALQTIFTGHTSGAWSVKTWTGSYTTLAEDHHYIDVNMGSADAASFAGGFITCQPMLPYAP